MVLALLGSAAVATLIAVVLSRSILEPIRAVTRAARAMAKGDLDQVVPGHDPRRAGRAGRRVQHDGPHDPRVPAGRDRPAAARAADGAGDDRLVPRPGGRRRPDRRRRAGQPGGPADPGRRRRPTASIPWVAAAAAPAARWPRCSAAGPTTCRPASSTPSASATTARSGSSCPASWRSAATTACSARPSCSRT